MIILPKESDGGTYETSSWNIRISKFPEVVLPEFLKAKFWHTQNWEFKKFKAYSKNASYEMNQFDGFFKKKFRKYISILWKMIEKRFREIYSVFVPILIC